jgi:pyruvate kinase
MGKTKGVITVGPFFLSGAHLPKMLAETLNPISLLQSHCSRLSAMMNI